MAERCPSCQTARVGAFRYCRSCGFDYEAGPPLARTGGLVAPPPTAPRPVVPSPSEPARPSTEPHPAASDQPAAGPAKRKVDRGILLAGLALLALITLAGLAYSAASSQVNDVLDRVATAISAVRSTSDAAASVDGSLVSIGTSVPVVGNDGHDLGRVLVVEADQPSDILGMPPDTGDHYVAVRVRYTAVAPWTYTLYDWSLHDGDRGRYEPLALAPDPQLTGGILNAGDTTVGWVAFAVPAASTKLWLDMEAADGTTVFSVPLR
jgi:hypothetical protein